MYAETGLMFPYLQNLNQEVQLFEDLSSSLKHNALLASAVSDYDLGAEGDLFKAPEPIIEDPMIGLDPMTAALTMISCGGEVIVTENLKESDIGSSINDGQLFSDVFYECKKDILAKEATGTPLSEVLDVKIPLTMLDEKLFSEDDVLSQGQQFQKSVSSGSLSSMHQKPGTSATSNFLDFQNTDLGAAYGMRRAFSEGDIKTLGKGDINVISSLGTQQILTSCTPEDRKEKLLRYRNKKAKRNFGRKVKYACRKALADSQPRIRGRFAKTEETEVTK